MSLFVYLWTFCALVYVESAAYVFRLHRKSNLNRVSALLLLLIAVYALLVGFTLPADTLAAALILAKLSIIASAFMGPLSLHFMLVVTRNDRVARRPAVLAALYVVPVLFSVYTFLDPQGVSRLERTQWGWEILPGSDQSVWDYVYFVYSCSAIIGGVLLAARRAVRTHDRLEKKQMRALVFFTVIALVESFVVGLYGVTGSARQDARGSMTASHVVSLAGLGLWLLVLRLTNWRYRLFSRLPETFAGNLLSAMNAPLFLLDRDDVIVFSNQEAAATFRRTDQGESGPDGLFFHELFSNGETIRESSKRLKKGLSRHESVVGVVSDLMFHVSLFPIFDDKDSYCGCLVMARANESFNELRRKTRLTNREMEILVLLDRGFRTRQISRALFISDLTAKTHIHNIYQKVGASSRVELTRLLRE